MRLSAGFQRQQNKEMQPGKTTLEECMPMGGVSGRTTMRLSAGFQKQQNKETQPGKTTLEECTPMGGVSGRTTMRLPAGFQRRQNKETRKDSIILCRYMPGDVAEGGTVHKPVFFFRSVAGERESVGINIWGRDRRRLCVGTWVCQIAKVVFLC